MKKFKGLEESHILLIALIGVIIHSILFVAFFPTIFTIWLNGGIVFLLIHRIYEYYLIQKEQ